MVARVPRKLAINYTCISDVISMRLCSLMPELKVNVIHNYNLTLQCRYSAVKSLSFRHLGPVSISSKTSYRKISWSLDAARFVFRTVRSLWNLTGTSAALLLTHLSNVKVMRWFKLPISRLRDFMRSYDKTSYRILKRGSGFGWFLRVVHFNERCTMTYHVGGR